MLVRVPTAKGSLDIELFDNQAPLACRCLKQQLDSRVWAGTAFSDVGEHALTLRTTKLTPEIGRETHRVKPGRGIVAYARNSTAELIFFRDAGGAAAGTVVGRLTSQSLAVLDSIASGPVQAGKLADPVRVDQSISAAQGRKRKLNITLADDRSEQLKQVIDFENRLRSARLGAERPI